MIQQQGGISQEYPVHTHSFVHDKMSLHHLHCVFIYYTSQKHIEGNLTSEEEDFAVEKLSL